MAVGQIPDVHLCGASGGDDERDGPTHAGGPTSSEELHDGRGEKAGGARKVGGDEEASGRDEGYLVVHEVGELRGERRGDAAALRDPHTFYDTSSYGPAAIGAMAAAVGSDALVHGSDRPVVVPRAAGDDIPSRARNAARLLGIDLSSK